MAKRSSARSSDLAFITPRVLTWALDRSPLSPETIAEKLNIDLDTLKSWERGSAHPPFAKAERLAEILNVPFGAFYLPKPLESQLPIPDRRSLRRDYKPSTEFLQLLNDVLVKQDWFRAYTESTKPRPALSFVGSFDTSSNVREVATNIRDLLGLTPELRTSVGSWAEYVSTIARRAEDAGVLVMRSSVVGNAAHRRIDVKEVQGFAVVDPVAPVVFVNSADYKTAQVFTLAHELAHIWIGQSAIDNPDPSDLESGSRIETFVNRVAANVLVPANEFSASWRVESGSGRLLALARRFWVSTLVILRRARELEHISQQEFFDLRQQELARVEPKKTPSGGDFYRNLVVRMGPKLTYTVLGEVNRNRIQLTEASRLLGVKVKTLVTFAEMAK